MPLSESSNLNNTDAALSILGELYNKALELAGNDAKVTIFLGTSFFTHFAESQLSLERHCHVTNVPSPLVFRAATVHHVPTFRRWQWEILVTEG